VAISASILVADLPITRYLQLFVFLESLVDNFNIPSGCRCRETDSEGQCSVKLQGNVQEKLNTVDIRPERAVCLILKQRSIHLCRQTIRLHQPRGERRTLRQLIAEEIVAGVALAEVEVLVGSIVAVYQCSFCDGGLQEPLPSHRDDTDILQVEGGIREEEICFSRACEFCLLLS
jgi:hypothetical protein